MSHTRNEPNAALEAMLLEGAANGYDVLGEPPPPPPGPPEVVEPLVPLILPAPDWRSEENERARRVAAEKRDYPAKRTKKTPRLDKARAIQAEVRGMGKSAP